MKIQYQKEVDVRMNKNKNEEREEGQSDVSHELPDWLQEFRENLVDESSPIEPWGTVSKDVKKLPVLLMSYQWSREQKWNPVRVSTISILTSRKTQTAIFA